MIRYCFVVLLISCVGGASEKTRSKLVDLARDRGGLIVHINATDGTLTSQLRRDGRTLVHGLSADPKLVQSARRKIRTAGEYGPVSIEQWTGQSLPYAQGLVNTILVSPGTLKIPVDELLRVLAPLGKVIFEKGAAPYNPKGIALSLKQPKSLPGCNVLIKPWPKDIDQWSHYLHDASNNAVAQDQRIGPPNAMQWEAPPKYSRSHEYDTSMPALVSADGRVYFIVDEGPAGVADPRIPDKWSLVSRDAFSGVLLWKRRLTEFGWKQWQRSRGRKDWSTMRSFRYVIPVTIPRRLVAGDGMVFAALAYNAPTTILDANTGKILHVVKESMGTDEMVYVGNRLFIIARKNNAARLLCVDPKDGTVKWTYASKKELLPSTLTAGAGRAFVCEGNRIIARRATDGKQLWTAKFAENTPKKTPRQHHNMLLTLSDNVILCLRQEKLLALDAASGKKLWEGHGGEGYGQALPPELYVIDGSVYYFARPSKKLEPWPNKYAYDLKTGKPTHKITVPKNLIHPTGHTRCYHAKATSRYLLLGSRMVEFLDLKGDNHARGDWLKPACRYGVMPANGLVYDTPNPCQCQITRTLHNLNALCTRAVKRAAAKAQLTRGPAYAPSNALTLKISAGDWPMFRHDARRSGASQSEVPSTLTVRWKTKVGRGIQQPAAAHGRLYVPCREECRIDCLDAATGEPYWSFTAGGRIDSAPTVLGAHLIFGAADGFVYSLRASDGALAWRFRAAPYERRIVSYDQLESAFKVHGSVLPLKDNDGKIVVYFSAGRSTYLDGGIHIYGLDAATGEQKYHVCLQGPIVDVNNPKKPRGFGALDDVLVTDGTYIFMRNRGFDRKLKEISRSALRGRSARSRLSSWGGLLDDNWWNRTFWFYGKEWPNHIANQAPKAGQILSFDANTTYAVKCYTKRNYHSPMFFPEKKGYLLVADRSDNEPYLYDGKKGSKKPIKWLSTVHPSQRFTYNLPSTGDSRSTGYTRTKPPKWMKWIPIRMRAMAVTAGKLVVAGPPDVLKKGDELAAFEGRAGGKLRVVDKATGATLSQLSLNAEPVFDGLITANGCVYVALNDNSLLCFGKKD